MAATRRVPGFFPHLSLSPRGKWGEVNHLVSQREREFYFLARLLKSVEIYLSQTIILDCSSEDISLSLRIESCAR